jgi:hypothetical protein
VKLCFLLTGVGKLCLGGWHDVPEEGLKRLGTQGSREPAFR